MRGRKSNGVGRFAKRRILAGAIGLAAAMLGTAALASDVPATQPAATQPSVADLMRKIDDLQSQVQQMKQQQMRFSGPDKVTGGLDPNLIAAGVGQRVKAGVSRIGENVLAHQLLSQTRGQVADIVGHIREIVIERIRVARAGPIDGRRA